MALGEQLKLKGWHISDIGLSDLLDGKQHINVDQMITKIVDVDLKEYGAKCLPAEISRGKIDKFGGNVVLQISHIRNVSQPKSLEKDLLSASGGSQFLRVQMTDGISCCYGLTLSNVTNLSPEVPPGTKIFLKPTEISVKQGFILLDNKVCKVLGGKVQHLVDKWELSRSAANSARKRSGGEDGSHPPPWVPFGHRINSNVDTKGKALDASNANTQGKENVEFDEQRKAVIAEALKTKEGTQKKAFSSSGVKQIESQDRSSSHNSMKSSNHGSGPSEKKTSGYDSRQNSSTVNDKTTIPLTKGYQMNGANRNPDKPDKNMESPAPSKPSGPSTLFDFLNVKMSLDEAGNSGNGNTNNPSNTQSNYQNKKPYNAQYGGNNSHQPNRKQMPNNNFKSNKPYGSDRQQDYGTRKQYSEPKFNSKGDYQQNYQHKQKYSGANRDVKQSSDTDFQYFKNLHQDPNYQKQYPSLNRNQDSNFQNKNESMNLPQRSYTDALPNSQQNSSGTNHEQSFSRDAKFQKPAMNSAQKSAPKHNLKKRYKEGDKVLAKYWEDEKFYPAVIYKTSSNTCVVQFLGFMNFEEVLYSDVYQSSSETYSKYDDKNSSGNNSFSGQNFEFRRGGKGRQYTDSKPPSAVHRNQKQPYQPRRDANNETHQHNHKGGQAPVRQLYVPPAQRSHKS